MIPGFLTQILFKKSLSWTMRILYLIKCLGKVVDNVVDMFDAY